MKLFAECIKDATVQSVHHTTAIGNSSGSNTWRFGNENYRFGRFRTQPTRTTMTDRKRRAANQLMASTSEAVSAKSPDQSLNVNEDDGIVHGSKFFSEIINKTAGFNRALVHEQERWQRKRRSYLTGMGGTVSEYEKTWSLPLEIKKADPDQHLIFGWASVIEKDGKIVIDKQGDIIPVEELENAAYDFVLNSRGGTDMHRRSGVAKIVESMVFSKDKQEALGIDLKQVGWWVGFKVNDVELWEAHKRGERPEFSIGGAAVPYEVDDNIFKRG